MNHNNSFVNYHFAANSPCCAPFLITLINLFQRQGSINIENIGKISNLDKCVYCTYYITFL